MQLNPDGGRKETHSSRNLRAVLPFRAVGWSNLGLFIAGLLLFLLALEWLKVGARGLTGILNSTLDLTDSASGFGFGWLASYLMLSGSPVAAVALTLFDVGSIDADISFLMMAGSCLGSSLIVTLVGLLYLVRGRSHGTSLLTGVLALIVAGSIYLPAIPLGFFMLGRDIPRLSLHLPTAPVGAPLHLILQTAGGLPLASLPH